MFERRPGRRFSGSDGTRSVPATFTLAACALTAVATLALANAPAPLVARLRQCQRQCVLPVQTLLAGAVQAPRSPAPFAESEQTARDLKAIDERRTEVTAAVEAALARLDDEQAADPSQAQRLLVPTAIEARIIGRQGRSFFAHTVDLDVGLADAVLPGAWVLNPSLPLVDQGQASGVERGHLVLAGRRVWGQVREVGTHVSTVQKVTAAGYRDLVQLAGQSAEGPRPGARGVLEGVGEPLCRVRLVPSTEPVEAGDLVLSAGGDELLPTPLVYGRIVRAERPRGGLHWELWMEPAAADHPDRVTVVRVSLNAARLAQREALAPSSDAPIAEQRR
jgi:hypothetical protein